MTKNTLILPVNKFNIRQVKIFYYYRHRYKIKSKIGYFTLTSIRKITRKVDIPLQKRAKIRGIIVNPKQWTGRADATQRKFNYNKILLVKKNFSIIGTRIIGNLLIDIYRKKYLTSFLTIL